MRGVWKLRISSSATGWLILLGFLWSGTADAGNCSNPTRAETAIIYNSDYHTYQFCNGTNWVVIGGTISPDTGNTFGHTALESTADTSDQGSIWTQAAALTVAATIASMTVYVQTAAGSMTMGIYDATGPGGGPGALKATTASFTPATGWNTVNLTAPVALAVGNYWLAWETNSNTLALEAESTSGTQDSMTQAYGALPNTFSTTPTTTTWNDTLYATLAGCTERNAIYNSTQHTYEFCNGLVWIPFGGNVPSGGGSGCSSPSGHEADVIYNSGSHTYQFCNGTNWIAYGGKLWQGATPSSGVGYFVMSKSTWNGNLGTQANADATCLTELTTNTGWKGYAQANANGQLTTGKVHAYLCDHEAGGNCTVNPAANITYYFADANNSAHGGNRFTIDANGEGPNNSTLPDWSQASYFGGIYEYWTGGRNYDHTFTINWGTGLWSTNTYCDANGSGTWNSAAAGKFGCTGKTGTLDTLGTWSYELGGQAFCSGTSGESCNNTYHLICFVNP